MISDRPNSHLTRVGWLFVIGNAVFVVFGGVTGIVLSQAPIDRAYHDTYYVVAHLHYAAMLSVFSLTLAAIYFALSRVRRFRFPTWVGYLHAALFFLGISLTFFPQLFLGRQSIPRRYIDYPETFALWNRLSFIGGLFAFAGLCLFGATLIISIVLALRRKPST